MKPVGFAPLNVVEVVVSAPAMLTPTIQDVVRPASSSVSVLRLPYVTVAVCNTPLSSIVTDQRTLLESCNMREVGTVGAGPMTVTAGLVLSCDNVMLLPATSANAEEEAVFAVPLVAPPLVVVTDTSVE